MALTGALQKYEMHVKNSQFWTSI